MLIWHLNLENVMKKFIQEVKADVEKQVVCIGIVTMIILALIMVSPLSN